MLAFRDKRGLGVRPVEGFPHMMMAAKALRYPGDPDDLQAFIEYLQLPIDAEEIAALLRLLLPGFAALSDPDALAELIKRLFAAFKRSESDRLAADIGGYPILLDAAGRYQQGQQAKAVRAPQKCDRLLVEAFLSDLRDDSNRKRAVQRHANLLLLLDDCDGETGDRLLDLIADCRRTAHHDGPQPDPLVIVAVRHRVRPGERPAAVAANDGKALRFVPLERGAPLPQHAELWRPVLLTPLDSDDALAMIRTMETGSDHQDADFVLALAGGHPAAVRELTDLLFDLQEAAVGPPGLFAGPWPSDGGSGPVGQASGTVLDHLLERFLDTGPARLDRLAVIASSAAGLDLAACNSVYHYLGWDDEVTDDETWLRTRLWIEDHADSGPQLHPFAARLLRQRLARDPALWDKVHSQFERHYDRVGGARSRNARLWHMMATVTGPDDAALNAVVEVLMAEIAKRPIEEFRLLVDTIATAPSRLAPAANAVLELNRIAGRRDRGDARRTVTRRLVAPWLHDTVYLDPRGELADYVVAENGYLLSFGRDSK